MIEPNAREVTYAGFSMSEQVALTSIWNPARIEPGLTISTVAPDAFAGTHAASARTDTNDTKQMRSHRIATMIASSGTRAWPLPRIIGA